MKLKLVKSDVLPDWYLIERAEHDGREWFEEVSPNCSVLRCSARFSDADIEGSLGEMIAIADAIRCRGRIEFKRCAVRFVFNETKAEFWSPRNSQKRGVVSIADADDLADQILKEIQ